MLNGNEIALALRAKDMVAPDDIDAGNQITGSAHDCKGRKRDVKRFRASPARARLEWEV
jgi:hypothetical protein